MCLSFFWVCLSPLQITNQSTISSFSSFVPSKAARAGSSRLTHDDASTSDQCPPKLQAVIDSFVEETSPNYVFSTDTKQMHELMLSHGLHDRNLNQNECERALCYHILNGLQLRLGQQKAQNEHGLLTFVTPSPPFYHHLILCS